MYTRKKYLQVAVTIIFYFLFNRVKSDTYQYENYLISGLPAGKSQCQYLAGQTSVVASQCISSIWRQILRKNLFFLCMFFSKFAYLLWFHSSQLNMVLYVSTQKSIRHHFLKYFLYKDSRSDIKYCLLKFVLYSVCSLHKKQPFY